MLKTETIVGTITHINERGLMDVRSKDGREFLIHRAMLIVEGVDCAESLRVGDRLQFIAKSVVSYYVEQVTGIMPSAR